MHHVEQYSYLQIVKVWNLAKIRNSSLQVAIPKTSAKFQRKIEQYQFSFQEYVGNRLLYLFHLKWQHFYQLISRSNHITKFIETLLCQITHILRTKRKHNLSLEECKAVSNINSAK